MKTLCEYMTNNLLPGFRALVAKKLMDEYNLTQTQVAKLLNTTQPAVSQYRRELRGKRFPLLLQNSTILKMIDETVKKIMNGDVLPEHTGLEFCRVCKFIRENNLIDI
ncbi:MAG: hypothetical protein J7K72_03130 [Candidatus Aenigmarchaeota archaeon]|nr:hypothetical protein [Candidatus Aenigmarchaeota archaeon]